MSFDFTLLLMGVGVVDLRLVLCILSVGLCWAFDVSGGVSRWSAICIICEFLILVVRMRSWSYSLHFVNFGRANALITFWV